VSVFAADELINRSFSLPFFFDHSVGGELWAAEVALWPCGSKSISAWPGWANQESLPKGESRKISLELSQFVSRGLSKHHGTGGQVCREKRASRVVWMEYEC